MKITEIYESYRIPESLQRHMLTVAALGKFIVDHWTGPAIEAETVIVALLVHDLGNLIKFDLSEAAPVIDPALHTPAWRAVQQEMVAEYGKSSHDATQAILSELGLPAVVRRLTEGMDAANVCLIAHDALEMQICEYADLRVTPAGLTSLSARLDDLHTRYHQRYPQWAASGQQAKNRACALQIENALQQHTNADVVGVRGEQLAAYLVELRDWDVKARPS